MVAVTRIVIPCILVIAIQLIATAPGLKGEVFAVGGAAGWTVPHKGMVNYTEWAAMLSSLNVGDTLLFTYPAGEHNVVQVVEDDFDRCRATNPIATFTDGQTLVNLPREGQYWFICGFSNHCVSGQKFVIDVINLPAERAPAPAPSAGDSNPSSHGGGGSNLGPAAAFAPSQSLSISPVPAAFGPSLFPYNSASHHHGWESISVSTFLVLTGIVAVF
ncbi:unnamed protein product [Calypogeia fissa]